MEFKQRMRVLGGKVFNDTVEGKKYDHTKLRVEMPVKKGSEFEFGNAEVEMQWGDHTNADKCKTWFPCECELTLTATSKGFEVIDCTRVTPAPAPGQK